MNILDTIIAKKKIELENRKKSKSISELESMPVYNHKTLVFKDYLLDKEKTGIIAEYKRKSPSKGAINNSSLVEEVTAAYTTYGASAISVLTDEEFFGGSLNDLQTATINDIPLLRKDFIIDEYQLIESKAYGADIVLLIAACLTKKEVNHLSSFANNIGLNVLLEIHNEQELEHLCSTINVIGVNNRDLKTFKVDINRSIELSVKIPASIIKISESGIDTVESIQLLRTHGYKGFLIGEKFMKENDPGAAFKLFTQELKNSEMKLKVCGINQLQQLKELDEIGVSYAGLIFYEQSTRCITNKLYAADVKPLELSLQKVGVFVNAQEDFIIQQVEDFGLKMVQLHGDETPGFCKIMSDQVTVIKAFRITQTNEQNIDWMIKPYEEYCDFYLFDTNRKNAYGGTGEKFDWEILHENKISKPFFLSGGIGVNDIEKLRAFKHPFFYCVDVNSRVEVEDGIKDMASIKILAEEILDKNIVDQIK